MTKFKVTCRCRQCGTVFSRILRSASSPDPRCPKRSCRVAEQSFGMDLAKPPPAVGGSLTARAVDLTAGMVMQDHGLTDLKDNLREGDTMAPKLPPALERQVESFWGGGARRGRMRGQFDPAVLGKRAMAGAFRDAGAPDPIAATHAARARPPVHIVAGDK